MTVVTDILPPHAASRLGAHGLAPRRRVRWNRSAATLYEATLRLGTGRIAQGGGLATVTSPHTGRSPNDRFIAREAETFEQIDWGEINVPLSRERYARLKADLIDHLNGEELWVRDARAGADERYGIGVRVISESPWHDLFARNMFLPLSEEEQARFVPGFTVYHAPSFQADPGRHGTHSSVVVAVSFADRSVLVAGTAYAGEIKKSIFSVLNFLLPEQGVLPMHCSANIGEAGDTALFFGLSGTGKTTLSADPSRRLIGDDEHGWSDDGVFNFEGGCYAKTIRLSAVGEPDIYQATRRFGTILENVVLDDRTREIDYDSALLTENTRASYPIGCIPGAVASGRGGHPENVVFLTADAFGVLPPVARLSPEQAMYHFLAGYTAKVAGTERGVTEPKATFSACFGAPFLPRRPTVYADLLGARLQAHGARAWLVNTGWTGGRYGTGSRMELGHTRAMVAAALEGALDDVPLATDPAFGLRIPVRAPGVPDDVLVPRRTWTDAAAYDAAAAELAAGFKRNFERFAGGVSDAVRAAGPA